MSNSYVSNLIKRVMDASFGSTWEEAVQEWEIVDCEEDETSTSMCVCGKENIRYLYTIQNRETGCVISPIGSSCIQKFEREDLSERAAVLEEMFKLYKAIRHGERIELTSDFFSRRLLFALYKDGAFSPSEYNGYRWTMISYSICALISPEVILLSFRPLSEVSSAEGKNE